MVINNTVTKLTLPELPKEIKTFNVTEVGRYTLIGYHPGLVASLIKGIGIENITSSGWLNNNGGKSAHWEFFDENGVSVGYITVPSDSVLMSNPEFAKLRFIKR